MVGEKKSHMSNEVVVGLPYLPAFSLSLALSHGDFLCVFLPKPPLIIRSETHHHHLHIHTPDKKHNAAAYDRHSAFCNPLMDVVQVYDCDNRFVPPKLKVFYLVILVWEVLGKKQGRCAVEQSARGITVFFGVGFLVMESEALWGGFVLSGGRVPRLVPRNSQVTRSA